MVLIVVAGGSFFGGMAFQKHKGTTAATVSRTSGIAGGQFAGRSGTTRAGGTTGGFGGGVTGQIVSMDASSITVKTQNGSTEIVYFSSSTPITKEVSAASSDLATGDNVVIRGSSSNGTVTATNISVVPTLPTIPTGAGAAGNAAVNIPPQN